jgi:hypothetical protein
MGLLRAEAKLPIKVGNVTIYGRFDPHTVISYLAPGFPSPTTSLVAAVAAAS